MVKKLFLQRPLLLLERRVVTSLKNSIEPDSEHCTAYKTTIHFPKKKIDFKIFIDKVNIEINIHSA